MTGSFGNGNYDYYLIKTDSVGDILWSKTYGGTNQDRCFDMKITSDGGYILAGNTMSFGNGRLYLVKTDQYGLSGVCNQKNVPTIVSVPQFTAITPNFTATSSVYASVVPFTQNSIAANETVIPPTSPPPICLVTVDSLSDNNIIVWDKPVNTPIDSIIIYRDTANNNYARIAAIPNDSATLSEFEDTVRALYSANGDPKITTWRYKIAISDTCGNISAMSPYHQSIFIQENGGNFSWNHYQIEGQPTPVPGLSNYLFQRADSSTGNFATIVSLSSFSTAGTDPQYSTFQNTASWRVITQWSTQCSATNKSKNYNSSISNSSRILSVGYNELDNFEQFKVYPNPNRGVFTVEVERVKGIGEIKVFDVLGRVVYKTQAPSVKNQDPRVEFQIDLSGQPAGVYNVQLSDEGILVNKKVVVE